MGTIVYGRVGFVPCRYDLIGVVNHMGTTGGGHYIAYINSCVDPEDSTVFDWNCYDDTYKYPLNRNAVKDNWDAYIFFYQLRQYCVCFHKQDSNYSVYFSLS